MVRLVDAGTEGCSQSAKPGLPGSWRRRDGQKGGWQPEEKHRASSGYKSELKHDRGQVQGGGQGLHAFRQDPYPRSTTLPLRRTQPSSGAIGGHSTDCLVPAKMPDPVALLTRSEDRAADTHPGRTAGNGDLEIR